MFNDYYPFGMIMPGRNFNSSEYKFGFNGMESDDEISGVGNSYTAEYWQYDPRLGRRWNRDPKPNPSISNYATFANNPLFYTDLFGDTIKNAASSIVKEKTKALENAQSKYDGLVSSHQGYLKKGDIRKYRKESGLKDAEKDLAHWQGVENKINSMISTFETVMPDEFNYLNNLPVNILVGYNPNVSPNGVNNPQSTLIPANQVTIMKSGSDIRNTAWEGSFTGDIEITLWGGGNNNTFKTNYLSNEFGDVDYFFKNVKPYDPTSFKKWATTGNDKYPGYRYDPTGAGQMSFKYQRAFEKKFNVIRKNYSIDKVDRINWFIHK